MGALELIFGEKTRTKLGVLTLDASISETHTYSSEATAHPVEEGVDVADHIQENPVELTIVGLVTNHPIYIFASERAPSPIDGDNSPSTDRVTAALDELKRLNASKELVTIVTSLDVYEDMRITSAAISRTMDTKGALPISIQAKQLFKVKSQTRDIPDPVEPAAAPVVDTGRKATSPATPEQSRSLLLELSEAIFGT